MTGRYRWTIRIGGLGVTTVANARTCPSCRAAVVSRYNPDPVCAPCLRAARDTMPTAPVWLWDSVPMRRALARLDLGAVVALLRAVTGLAQEDLANLIEGWSQTTVSMVERNQRSTLYDVRELLRFADVFDMPRSALLPLLFGDPDVSIADVTGVSENVDRRTFNKNAVGVAVAALAPVPAPNRVERADIRLLRSSLHRLRAQNQEFGGGAILEGACRLFARARSALGASDYTEEIGRQLLVLCAEIGEVAGWAAYDGDMQDLARTLYKEAGLLANSSGDPEVRIHVLTNLAQQSTQLAATDPNRRRELAREALRFVTEAAGVALRQRSPKLHALIAIRRARAHAELGDKGGFQSAIEAAWDALDRGDHPADPPWASFITPSEVMGYTALGHEALARAQDGQDLVERATLLYREVLDDKDRSPRDHMIYQVRLARVLVLEGDHAQAFEEGLALLPDLGERMVSKRILNDLRPVREVAQEARHEEFIGRFDAAARSLAAA